MKKPWKGCLISALAGLAVVSYWPATRAHEPVYQGKTVTEWIEDTNGFTFGVVVPAFGRRVPAGAGPTLKPTFIPAGFRFVVMLSGSYNVIPDVITPNNSMLEYSSLPGFSPVGSARQSSVIFRSSAAPMPTLQIKYQQPTNAPQMRPEAIPFLIAGLQRTQTWFDLHYPSAWARIPGGLRGIFPKPRPLPQYVRANSAVRLGAMGSEAGAALPSLVAALDDKDVSVVETAQWAISRVMPDLSASEEIVAGLCRQHASTNEMVRRIELLKLHGPSTCRALAEALDADDADLRLKAIGLLKRQGRFAQIAIPRLIKLIATSDSAVRFGAVDLLEELGPNAVEAVPALRAAQMDENAMMRSAVRRALMKIAPE